MIETHDLTKMYGDLYALNRLNLTLDQGDVYGFIGPNGAGKTTTMRILATLLNPTWGEATVCGYSIYTGAKEIRRAIGYMPDFFGVYDDMKVIEYLEFFAAAYRIKGPARKKICEEVLELVDLTYKRDALVTSLSRGMTQRLGLARVLLHDPQVLLLDEPASGLDPRARIEIRALLKELRTMGKTILVSSHILPELADICNKIGIIEQGVLLVNGAVVDVMRQVRTDIVLEHRRRRPPDRRRQPARKPARGRERPGQERRPDRQDERGGQPVRLPRQPPDRERLRADPLQGGRDQPRDRLHAPDQGDHELSSGALVGCDGVHERPPAAIVPPGPESREARRPGTSRAAIRGPKRVDVGAGSDDDRVDRPDDDDLIDERRAGVEDWRGRESGSG